MGDRMLGEAEWKKFSKGRGYKDAALLKALDALERAGRGPAADQLKALDEVERQAQALLKQHKGDKELSTHLDGVDKALARQRKLAQQAQEEESQAEEDEDAGPALLTTKMVPLLRQVRKGETLQAMVATAGKDAVVLLSRKPIGPPRRKMLAEQLGVSGGIKYLVGECIFEENAHTFVLRASAGGLAKRLKAALLEQTGQRVKVRVRGESPDDVDDDGDDAVPDDEAAPATAPAKDAAKDATKPSRDGIPDDAAARSTAFKQRLAALLPRVKAVIVAGSPVAAQIKQIVALAGERAQSRDFAAADKGLAGAELALDRAERSLRSYQRWQRAAQDFRTANEDVDAQITRLQRALRESGDGELAEIADKGLNTVTGNFKVPLLAALHEIQGGGLAAFSTHAARARGLAQRFLAHVDTADTVAVCDTNPLAPVSIRATLGPALRALAQAEQD